jgi:hypothetical protein
MKRSVLFTAEFFMLAGMLGTTWLALAFFSQANLKKRFPNINVKVVTHPGKRGMSALGLITLVFTALAVYVHYLSA